MVYMTQLMDYKFFFKVFHEIVVGAAKPLPFILDLVEPICAVANLLVLGYITRREWKYERQTKMEAHIESTQNAILTRKKVWYDSMVTERVVSEFFICFESIERALGEDDANIENRINEVKKEMKKCRNHVIPVLMVFEVTLARNINRLLQDYEDYIMNNISSTNLNDEYLYGRQIQQMKANLFEFIYMYDFRDYNI